MFSLFKNINLIFLVHLTMLTATSLGFSDQKQLDDLRMSKINKVLKSLQENDAKTLSTIFGGHTEEEMSKLLKQIKTHWGDLKRLVIVKNSLPKHFHKGNMQTIVHWGTDATQIGRWLNLRSIDTKGRYLRIGLLFKKGSSEPKQFLAIEWNSKIE